jgi:hypothetical protein
MIYYAKWSGLDTVSLRVPADQHNNALRDAENRRGRN